MATATKGMTICWSGEAIEDKRLMDAMTKRLPSAGYVLVPSTSTCDVSLGFSLVQETAHGADYVYRRVKFSVYGRGNVSVDRIQMEFEDWEVPADEPDRLAILLVNALNASPKVAAYFAAQRSKGTSGETADPK